MPFRTPSLLLAVLLVLAALPLPQAQAQTAPNGAAEERVVDDFEANQAGAYPRDWRFITSSKEAQPLAKQMNEQEKFYVVEERSNKFVRAYTSGEAQRITLRNDVDFDWSLDRHPRLQWEWRARQLPEGASEKDKNDAGGAVYVTFGSDWLGRPISIKYTYSSTLPVGTVVEQGPLRVLVVDSAAEPGMGGWQTVQRDVIADYRQLFGGAPPNQPVSITLWSDSDTTGGEAEVDFDDIKLLPPYQQ